ncbi:MAG: iron ABC transporter permease, partial [Roseomonas sp.]|nr:iron ABC transporter permease [Roseomonas sp.]
MSATAAPTSGQDPARPAARPRARRTPGWAWASVVAAGLIAAPLVSVLVTALAPGGGSWLHLGRTVLPDLLVNSVLLAVLVGVLAATMGA